MDSSTLYGTVSWFFAANMFIRSSTGSGRERSLTAKVVSNCSIFEVCDMNALGSFCLAQ